MRVEVVSLAEWVAGCRGSDLHNQASQVIRWMRKMKSARRKCGAETRVEGPVEKVWKLSGAAAEAEDERMEGEMRMRDKDEGRKMRYKVSDEMRTRTRM